MRARERRREPPGCHLGDEKSSASRDESSASTDKTSQGAHYEDDELADIVADDEMTNVSGEGDDGKSPGDEEEVNDTESDNGLGDDE